MERRSPHFIAVLKYLTTEEGGRTTPARSGYRTQLKFSFEEIQTSGQQVFIGKETVRPGESVQAEITMVSPEIFKGRLSCGTTASFTILPGMQKCKEFVNADSIAAGLSPFNPESVAVEAGRLMLSRIHELMKAGVDFAFETTLATRSYVSLFKAARQVDYKATLLFIWLDSPRDCYPTGSRSSRGRRPSHYFQSC
jgi:hypothetical protein